MGNIQGELEFEITPEMDKCIDILGNNGWYIDVEPGVIHFYDYGRISVEITEDELIFISKEGDFMSRPIDKYTLIGVLVEFHQLPLNYKS